MVVRSIRQIIIATPFVVLILFLKLQFPKEFITVDGGDATLWETLPLLTFIYLIILAICYALHGYFLEKANFWVSSKLEDVCKELIRVNEIRKALFIVKIDYYWGRVYNSLGLMDISHESVDKGDPWRNFGRGGAHWLKNIFEVLGFLFSAPIFIALILSGISLNIIQMEGMNSGWALGFMANLISFKVDIVSFLSQLSLIGTLITALPVIGFFYFYSLKRDARKIVEQENDKHLEEVVLLYQGMLAWIEKNFRDVERNYDYLMGNLESIVHERLKNKVPNYRKLENGQEKGEVEKKRDSCVLDSVKEFEDINEFFETICKLSSGRLSRITAKIASRDYDMQKLHEEILNLNDLNKVENLFFTKYGMLDYISQGNDLSEISNKKMLDEEKAKEYEFLLGYIYRNLRGMHVIMRGKNSLKNYLDPSGVERFLVKIVLKKK